MLLGDGEPQLKGYRGPVMRAHVFPTMLLPNARIVAFAGIGRPAKFFSSLKTAGADLAESHAFADHHPYTADEILRLKEMAANADAVLMTTEKDLARMDEKDRAGIRAWPICAEFDEPDAMERLLDRIRASDGRAARAAPRRGTGLAARVRAN